VSSIIVGRVGAEVSDASLSSSPPNRTSLRASESVARAEVRPITDDEVEHFFANGWVTLPALIRPTFAAELLVRARRLMGIDGTAQARLPGEDEINPFSSYQPYLDPDKEDDLFRALATARKLGHNAARLLGSMSSVRLLRNDLAVKLPMARMSHRGQPTPFHQDQYVQPVDRNMLNFWIALADVTPEQGSLVFRSGSHRLGLLGPSSAIASWPRLAECPLTEPHHLRAGDATVHHGLTVHGAPENSTDRARWATLCAYFPSDAPDERADGFGLASGEPLDYTHFPLVYEPDRATPDRGL
jgi:hypothetical protein